MKLSKTKKIILLGATLGILATAIVIPVLLLNNNEDEQNKKDVEKVIKILEEKNEKEKIITLPSDTKGKIIANNQAKIIAKIKTLIGSQNLKEVKIEVSMSEDKNILTTKQEIIIKVSKGEYSKKVASAKAYFVKRQQNDQEITADINSVKTALTNLTSKDLKLFTEKTDKSINANKKAILNILKQVEGYSKIDFKDVKIKVKDDASNLPSSKETPINITFILSKGNVTPVEINIFTIKQLDSVEVQNINNKLNEIKSSLESLNPKILKVDAPSSNKTINHNKDAIKSVIENLNGYDAIEFDGTSLEIKDSNQNLPTNNQPAIPIILVLSKNNVNLEVQGFSAKQMLFSTTINNEIMAIKRILDGKSNQDLIITLPSSSTGTIIGGTIIGNINNKDAIEKKLRILIDPSNANGEANHSSLKGTTIEVSKNPDALISTTPQDIVVSISKTGGRTLSTRKTFRVKRNFTIDEDIIAIKNILDAKSDNDLIITLPSNSTGKIIGNTTNKNEIIKKLRILIDPSNANGESNHSSLKGTTIEVSMSTDALISTTPQDIVVSISKNGGTTLSITNIFQVKKASTAEEDIQAIKNILDAKSDNDLIITLPSDTTGRILDNQNEIIKKLRILIDPSNINGEDNHPSLRGAFLTISGINLNKVISTTPQYIDIGISKIPPGISFYIRNKFQIKKS